MMERMCPVQLDVSSSGSFLSSPSSSTISSGGIFSQDENMEPDTCHMREDGQLLLMDCSSVLDFREYSLSAENNAYDGPGFQMTCVNRKGTEFDSSSDNCLHFPERSDDDLTSLAWLQDANLLKNLAGDCHRSTPFVSRRFKELTNCDLDLDLMVDSCSQKKCEHSNGTGMSNCVQWKIGRPRISFSLLIFMAIEDSPEKHLPVRSIYEWITRNFPYFRDARPGWKNSIRHNLSFNRFFKNSSVFNVKQANLQKKGSKWYVDPQYRGILENALLKSGFHAYGQSAYSQLNTGRNKPKSSWSLADKHGDKNSCSDLDVASTLVNLSSLIAQQKRSEGASLMPQWTTDQGQQSRSMTRPSLGKATKLLEEATKLTDDVRESLISTSGELCGTLASNVLNDNSRTMEGIDALLGLASAVE